MKNKDIRVKLRYGENPNQNAYLIKNSQKSIFEYQISGKKISYNNLIDLDSGLKCLAEFQNPTSIIIKHTNPCGVASGKNLLEAFNNAMACDPISAFGGIIVFNKKVQKVVANKINKYFFEMIVAPGFDGEAERILTKKKNLRLISLNNNWRSNKMKDTEFRSVIQGTLIQEPDTKLITKENLEVVTKLSPTNKEIKDLIFAWTVVKLVKSNGIVIVQNMKTIGIGSRQPSRIDSSKIAIRKALELSTKSNKIRLKNAVMASDAFFPFSDGIEDALANGINAIIQPGGSIRDDQVIQLADKRNVSMVFTGIRSFKH